MEYFFKAFCRREAAEWMINMNYTDFEQLPLVLSVNQLVDVLKIGRNTAYELLRCGKIKSIRVGHQIRIPKEAVLRFLQES